MIVPFASIRAILFSPCGHDMGFVPFNEIVRRDFAISEPPSSAAKIVETRLPPGLRILASRRIASGPLTRSRTASTPSG